MDNSISPFNVLDAELATARKIFWLLRQDYIFLGSYNEQTGKHDEGAYPVINCNDLFVPAADGERLEEKDLDFYLEVCQTYGIHGTYAWCGFKRNANPWKNRDDPEYYAALEGVKKMAEKYQK